MLKKYPDELRERAIRFALDLVDGSGKLSVNAASKQVGEQLGIVPDSLRNWVQRARVYAGGKPGLTTDERARLTQLERENRKLRLANAILKSASASSRPSSTGYPRADRLHRPAPQRVRSRADRPRPVRRGRPDRSEHLLRRQDPTVLGSGGPRRAAQAARSEDLRRQPRGLRRPQDLQATAPRGTPGAALPGRRPMRDLGLFGAICSRHPGRVGAAPRSRHPLGGSRGGVAALSRASPGAAVRAVASRSRPVRGPCEAARGC